MSDWNITRIHPATLSGGGPPESTLTMRVPPRQYNEPCDAYPFGSLAPDPEMPTGDVAGPYVIMTTFSSDGTLAATQEAICAVSQAAKQWAMELSINAAFSDVLAYARYYVGDNGWGRTDEAIFIAFEENSK